MGVLVIAAIMNMAFTNRESWYNSGVVLRELP